MRRAARSIAVAGGAAALAASALAAGLALRPPSRDALLAELAHGNELDVAFAWDRATGLVAVGSDSGEPGITLVDTRAGGVRRLPLDSVWARRPALSPGGRYLAYHELDVARRSWEHRVSIIDLHNESVRRVRDTGEADFVSQAAFSPSGTLLAYELVHRRADDAWSDELRLFDLDSGADVSLFHQPGVPARGPAWAADGRSLYVLSGNCVRQIAAAGGGSRVVACVDGADARTTPPEPPSIAADGRLLAFTVELGGCPHVAVADTGTGRARLVDRAECASHPVLLAGPRPRLAYVAQLADGSRAPRVRALDEAAGRGLGFDVAITYALAPDADGGAVALLGAPGVPRSIWRLREGRAGELIYAPLERALWPRVGGAPSQVTVTAPDGLAVPVRIFPSSCRSTRPRPAVLFVHPGVNGSDDVSPRMYPEIAYLNAMGLPVYAVNYRGSTGYGPAYKKLADDQDGKRDDVEAAWRWLRDQPTVAPDQMFVFGSCYGNGLIAPLVERVEPPPRGVIEWVAPPAPWLADAPSPATPPLLWINGSDEPGAAAYDAVAEAARARGHALEYVALPEGHWILHADSRARALERIRRFIESRAPAACE